MNDMKDIITRLCDLEIERRMAKIEAQPVEQAEKQEKLCKYCGGIGRVVCDGRCMPEQEPVAWMYIEPDNEFKTVHIDDCDYSQFPNDEWFPVYTAPNMSTKPENIDTSEERVHETDKSVHEPVAYKYTDKTNPLVFYFTERKGKDVTQNPDVIETALYTAPQKYCPSENNAAYEKGFVEGMAKQTHSIVDRAVNAMAKRLWVGLTDEEIVAVNKEEGTCWEVPDKHATTISKAIEAKLRERNT